MIKNAKTSGCVRNLRLKLHWNFKYLGKSLIIFLMLVLYEVYQCCFFSIHELVVFYANLKKNSKYYFKA